MKKMNITITMALFAGFCAQAQETPGTNSIRGEITGGSGVRFWF
jgi:hypothetical protein